MKKTSLKHSMEMILFVVSVLLLWQIFYELFCQVLGIWKAYAMPSPLGVWNSLRNLVERGTLQEAVGKSLLRGFIGYISSIWIGGSLGFLIHRVSFLKRNVKPLIMGIQTLPSICWVPFSILWFGLTEQAILFVVIMGSAFSMAIAFDNAISNVAPIYAKAAQTMGATDLQIFWNVVIPASMPQLVGGLKQGWAFAWRALMSGEVMTTSVGLGQTLIIGRNLSDIDQVMLIMLVIIIIGIVVEKVIFETAERRLAVSRGIKE